MSYRRPGGSPPPSVPISRGPKVIKTVGGGGGGGGGGGKKTGGSGCAMVPATAALALGLALGVTATACHAPRAPHGSPRSVQSTRQATPHGHPA